MRAFLQIVLYCVVILLTTQRIATAQEFSEAEVTQLMNKSISFHENGHYQDALDGFLKVGEQTRSQRTEIERQVYACSQTMAVMCYQHLGDSKNAFRLAEEVLKGNLSEEERNSLLQPYVLSGYHVALECMKDSVQQYAQAREVFNRILPFADPEMQRRILPRQPLTWYMEGLQYEMALNHKKALTCMEEARLGFQINGVMDNEVETLLMIGELREDLYDPIGARQAYQEADSLSRIIDDDAKRISVLQEMQRLNEILGDNESSWRATMQIDSLRAASDNAQVKFRYNNQKGDEARRRGDYKMAERWYLKNKSFVLSEEGKKNRWTYYNKLQGNYTASRQLDQAIEYALKAKHESQLGLDASDESFYYPYRGIAYIYSLKGDSLNCFQNLDTLFRAERLFDPVTSALFLYYSRGNCYFTLGEWERALDDYRKAYNMIIEQDGEDSSDGLGPLLRIAITESRLGHYDNSERCLTRYAQHVGKLSGRDSQDYIDALGYLANVEAFANHKEEAYLTYIDATERLRTLIRRKLPYCTSEEREGFWENVSSLVKDMTPFALEAKENQTAFTQVCYDGLILTKAFLLSSEQSTFDLIKKKGTPQDMADYAHIQALRFQMNKWENDGAYVSDSLLQLTSRINQLESQLATHCRAYGDVTAFMDINYEKVKASLGEKDILLDFTDFVSKSRGRIYATYIVDRQQKYPLLKELFTESEIDSMHVREPYQFYSGIKAERLYELLWTPLREHLVEGSTVYYVPTQMLFQIALESIPLEDGTLLGDHYNFVRLSSARELVRYKARLNFSALTDRKDAILYGGLQYSLDGATMAHQASKHDVPRMLVFRGDDERLKGQKRFDDLPGTQEEIDSIYTTLKSVKLTVQPYSGKEGTEESFLSMSSKAPRILHMATHGFYYTPDAAQNVDYLQGYTDAMSLSGLVLAGGNAAWLGQKLPEGVLGGILTAADIARMDLSDTEMVVLSACHSGKGEATPEGLYGLQRAFKKAGVKTIIMSLWAESDVVGPEFMTLFYKNLVGKSRWDKHKAFDAAKDAIRKKYPDSPSYWAGFVMLD